jgi:cyclase
MISARIIPVLSINKRRLVKTVRFRDEKYLGDPINAIKIFNEKWVDELVVIDIGSTKLGLPPDTSYLKMLASECFIPMAYGGGVCSFETAGEVFKCGVEKVVINSGSFPDFKLIDKIASFYGSQSVIVSIDYKKNIFGARSVYFRSGQNKFGLNVEQCIRHAQNAGAGEILLHDISRDGTFSGYDNNFISEMAKQTNLPIIACGGARNKTDLENVTQIYGASAAAAGSCFVFKNNNRNSILINYGD